jgi:endonuclease III
VRIVAGNERENYSRTYREAQQMIASESAATFEARMRAFLLPNVHGQRLCKRTNPKCADCPVAGFCVYNNSSGAAIQ